MVVYRKDTGQRRIIEREKEETSLLFSTGQYSSTVEHWNHGRT